MPIRGFQIFDRGFSGGHEGLQRGVQESKTNFSSVVGSIGAGQYYDIMDEQEGFRDESGDGLTEQDSLYPGLPGDAGRFSQSYAGEDLDSGGTIDRARKGAVIIAAAIGGVLAVASAVALDNLSRRSSD